MCVCGRNGCSRVVVDSLRTAAILVVTITCFYVWVGVGVGECGDECVFDGMCKLNTYTSLFVS